VRQSRVWHQPMWPLNKNFLTEETQRGRHINSTRAPSALVAEALVLSARFGRTVRLRVFGESMLPTLWPGDVVEIESCSLENVRAGEIVLAQRDDRLVMHRLLVRCGQNNFLLRGDSVACPDPPFPSQALLGRLVRRADERRGLTPSGLHPGFGAKWSRTVGMVLCHWGLARRVALKVHSRGKASARGFSTAESAATPVSAGIAERGVV
jgi:Peptidase S24-like